MFDNIIAYSIKHKLAVGMMVIGVVIWGLFSLKDLPLDAVPDITNNQVQIITTSPTLSTQEVERLITTPIEISLQHIQKLEEIRSISRYGLSVITVVFEESLDIYLARQLVQEQLSKAIQEIPSELGTPEMAPISTGLGEIYQYVLYNDPSAKQQHSLTELRTIQDWIVKRQLAGVEGIVEVNTLGGHLKQYEVSIDPLVLRAMDIQLPEIYDAIHKSNENTGGAFIEKNPNAYFIRTEGIASSKEDIEKIVVKVSNGNPILIKDVATVQLGHAPRFGALTKDSKEAVGGTVMMLKGENSAKITANVKSRIAQIQKSLPKGVILKGYLDRDKLINTAIGTIQKNLIEGGLIVIFILVIMLGNWRAGMIVASVIPISMLFTVGMMRQLGISANLMSLGAIDFGLIVDGAVIIVEAIVHRLFIKHAGQSISQKSMDDEVLTASKKIRNSAAFGEIIILIVYLPILTLVGIEGKMFRPMAQTVMLAITGALILSLTYVPMMSALFLNKKVNHKKTIADRIIDLCYKIYQPALKFSMRNKIGFVISTVGVLVLSLWSFFRMGGEFIPTLEEGDVALHQILPPGSSLTQSVEVSKIIQKKLLHDFPEIEDIVTKIGSAEIPTDPMPVETGDIMVILAPKDKWTSASTKNELFEKMEKSLHDIPGVKYEFSQPIQMRFNELMTGSRADIAIKIFGEDLETLSRLGKKAEQIIRKVPDVGSVKVEETTGFPQIVISYDYQALAQYGLHVKDVNSMIKMCYAGEKAGVIYEGDRTFDLVVRMDEASKKDIEAIGDVLVPLPTGQHVALRTVANVAFKSTPMQISRDDTKRRIVIGVNVGETDMQSLVTKIQKKLENTLELPAGYHITYGGQFENLKQANARLSIVVPLALALIFILLYFTFKSLLQAMLIFMAIPFSAIGGIWALHLRDLPFSISAGIGFIALFGVAVLNGIVLIGHFNELKKEGIKNLNRRIFQGTKTRLRPVLMTAAVASLGFIPMAVSNSGGAEVQRPLATVVIGGLLSATFLTLIMLPILYYWLEKWTHQPKRIASIVIPVLILFFNLSPSYTQAPISLNEAVTLAIKNNPLVESSSLQIDQYQSLGKIKYGLGNTEILYQGDGLYTNNDQRVQQIRVIQSIPNPTVHKATLALNEAHLSKSKVMLTATTLEIEKKVRDFYLQIQYHQALDNLYQEKLVTIETIQYVNDQKASFGDIPKTEATTLLIEKNELLINKQKNIDLIQQLKSSLSILINMDNILISDTLNLYKQSSEINNTLTLLQLHERDIWIATNEIEVLKAQLKPSFSFGYAGQQYYEGGWLHGLEGGVTFSLFNQSIKKRLSAQSMDIQIKESALNYQTLLLEQALDQYKKIKEQKLSLTKELQNQLSTIYPKYIASIQLQYKAGEINHLEWLKAMNSYFQTKALYLEQLYLYNEADNNLQFLLK